MRLPGSRRFYVMLALVALGAVLLANAHLVYVASTSQPQCVEHAGGDFGAAKPSC